MQPATARLCRRGRTYPPTATSSLSCVVFPSPLLCAVVRIIAVIGLITGIIACIIGLANGRGVVFSLTTGLLLTIGA
jgi:hypothetical protein